MWCGLVWALLHTCILRPHVLIPNTTQHNTTQHNTTQHNTTQHNTTQHNTTQHNTTQHNTTQHNTTQHNTTQHDTTQHDTTRHDTTQHDTTRHNTTRHDTTQHDTTRHDTTRHDTTQHNTTQHNMTRKRWWEPSARTKRGATAEMASTTSTPQSWGDSASPRSPPSMWLPRRRTGSRTSTSVWTRRLLPEVDLTWLLRRPYSFLPPVPCRDQCQLSPTALSDWLQDRAAIPARAGYEARWGVNYMPGAGLPLDWFDSDQQRHVTAHRMDNIPTMTVLAHRSSHRDTVLDTTCLLCGAQPETAPHLWACSAQAHEWGPARRRLAAWLDQPHSQYTPRDLLVEQPFHRSIPKTVTKEFRKCCDATGVRPMQPQKKRRPEGQGHQPLIFYKAFSNRLVNILGR